MAASWRATLRAIYLTGSAISRTLSGSRIVVWVPNQTRTRNVRPPAVEYSVGDSQVSRNSLVKQDAQKDVRGPVCGVTPDSDETDEYLGPRRAFHQTVDS
jgi:hypothetical protein